MVIDAADRFVIGCSKVRLVGRLRPNWTLLGLMNGAYVAANVVAIRRRRCILLRVVVLILRLCVVVVLLLLFISVSIKLIHLVHLAIRQDLLVDKLLVAGRALLRCLVVIFVGSACGLLCWLPVLLRRLVVLALTLVSWLFCAENAQPAAESRRFLILLFLIFLVLFLFALAFFFRGLLFIAALAVA